MTIIEINTHSRAETFINNKADLRVLHLSPPKKGYEMKPIVN